MIVKERIPSLDGFRAISIGLVIFSHLSMTDSLPPGLNKIVEQVFNGKVGVEIFFVISGFLITLFLIKEKEQTGQVNLKSFYTRRVLRIFPAFYFYLFSLWVLNSLMVLQIPSLVFLSSALYVYNFTPWVANWFISHSWSLAVEEQFYILWPALFLALPKSKSHWMWIFALILGSLMRSFHYKYTDLSEYFLAEFFMYSDFLFSGCFMAFIFYYKKDWLVRMVGKINPIIVYLSIFAIWFFYHVEFHPVYDIVLIPTSGTIVNVCICFLLFYFIVQERSLGYKLLNSQPAIFIGKLSYSLYLWQQFFIGPHRYWFTAFPQNIFLTFMAALFSYYIIERPFLSLKKQFNPFVNLTEKVNTDPVNSQSS